MKCKNIVDGKVCGEDIIPPSRFCGICGGKVDVEPKNVDGKKLCPQCSTKITQRQKFCTGCGWRIDPNIFTTKIVCTGITDEGKTCGLELDTSVWFCPECGTDQRKSLQECFIKVKVDEVPEDRQPKRPRQEDETSESSCRSDSPDSWEPPGAIPATSDDVNRGREVMEVSKTQPTPEEENLADHSEDFIKENVDDFNMEMTDMTESSTLPVLTQSITNDTRPPEIFRPETSSLLSLPVTSDTGSPVAHRSETETLLILRQIVESDPGINQEKVMETDTSHVIENENTNAIVTLPDFQAKEHSSQTKPLSESGNPAALAEMETKPSDMTDHSRQSDKDGHTACTEQDNEQPKTSDSEEQGIPPHSMISRSSVITVQCLTKLFEKSVHLSGLVENTSCHYESETNQTNKDLKNSNFPVEENSSDFTEENETGDINVSSPMTQDDSSDSTSADENNEDISKTDQSSKPKQNKRQKNKKKKTKENRKHNKQKGETDSVLEVPAMQGQKDQESGTTPDLNTEKQDHKKMEHKLENNGNRNEEKNKSDSTVSSEAMEMTHQNKVATGTDASEQSRANIAASTLNQGSNNRNRQFVDVHFHCIVGPPSWTSFERDKLFIVFEDSRLGGWKSRKYLMRADRTLENNCVKFSGVVTIPKSILYHNTINYNYIMEHGEGKYTWEYVYSGSSSNSIYRTLNVGSRNLIKGVYHRYDGVVRVKNPLQQSSADDYKQLLYKDAELACKTFQPHWKISSLSGNGVNGEELINQVHFVVEGLKEVYCKKGSLWGCTDFEKIMGSVILQPTMQKVLMALYRKEGNSYEVRILRLVTAITMAYMIMEYDISLEHWAKNVLCETFLPLPDHDRKVSCDIDGLLSFFPETRKKVTEAVLKLSRKIASNTTNPVWLYCLPVLHFLQGKCKPFEEASSKVNHNDQKPEWWGIAEFNNDIDYFKHRNDPWQRSHIEVLHTLSPYFQMDYLLPRSFITALKPEQILDVINSGLFPSDVIQAVIFYYIKNTIYSKDKVKPLLIMMFCQVLMQHKAEKQRRLSLGDAWRTCKLSGDILKESINIRLGNDLIFLALESFLVSLDLYDKVQESVDFQSKTVKEMDISKESHVKIFESLCHDFCKWMTNQPYYKEELAFLQNWNKALKVQVPQGNIKERYLKYVEESLKKFMQRKETDEVLVNIYLLHSEEFENVIQALLSEIALKATCRFSDFNKVMIEDRVLMRLGDLMSKVLERSWNPDLTSDPHQMLKHAVTWAHFPTFIEIYYKFAKYLNAKAILLLDGCIKVLRDTVSSLLDGGIIVRDLQEILVKRDNFIKVVHTMKDVNVQSVTSALNLREKELQTYLNTYKTVQELTYFTVYCQVDSIEMEDKIRALENASSFALNDLVQTMPIEEVHALEEHQPFVTVFGLTQDQLKMPSLYKTLGGKRKRTDKGEKQKTNHS